MVLGVQLLSYPTVLSCTTDDGKYTHTHFPVSLAAEGLNMNWVQPVRCTRMRLGRCGMAFASLLLPLLPGKMF